ncbi:MAG: hypothetical protein NZM29_07845 [Nitrospira sp.]|nr:hypothetical protein [Nitrospira sp.]
MRFDPALAARDAFYESRSELGSDWETAVELERTFSSTAGAEARAAYDGLLALARRHQNARSFQTFCIYIAWQQATEEPIARHFRTGLQLCDAYLAAENIEDSVHLDRIRELRRSFRTALGLEAEDDMQSEYTKDTPKGGD